jgi:hypothetical protein
MGCNYSQGEKEANERIISELQREREEAEAEKDRLLQVRRQKAGHRWQAGQYM